VHAGSPVFPGDTPYQQQWAASIGPGCPVNVSSMTLSPHVGAHADAPLHYDPQGQAAGALDLLPYLGPCRVIHAMGCGPLVQWQHLQHALARVAGTRAGAHLCAHAVDRWDGALSALRPTCGAAGRLGVTLIGIDTASIDPADSKTLDSHQVIRQRNMRVLENLVLDEVPEGDYELIALPLKLMTADDRLFAQSCANSEPGHPEKPMTTLQDCRALDAQDPLRRCAICSPFRPM
jgi:arylformamidase